ncbi:hypothetical protein [Dyadobacter diqingensis]|uniref:hypothetical protein n=1 Tax=Dyadobacter diqingensis TaxID=2938121 RepID=UPI0020C19713|nr:hypothetical protein [Dyadobacter diqingensis]
MKKYIKNILLAFILMNGCNSRPEVFRLDVKGKYPDFLVDYFIIKNPPDDINEIITIVNNNLDTTFLKKNIQISTATVYGQIYFKERFFFDRSYKPHFKLFQLFGSEDDIRDTDSHYEDRFVSLTLKDKRQNCRRCPNMPIYAIYFKKLLYYPNGFRNNPNKHWEKMKD